MSFALYSQMRATIIAALAVPGKAKHVGPFEVVRQQLPAFGLLSTLHC